MKLRTALNVVNESRYLLYGEYGSKYEGLYLLVDYLHKDIDEQLRIHQKKESLKKENPTVKYIDYNKAENCIMITLV